jgi:hypothetical protein
MIRIISFKLSASALRNLRPHFQWKPVIRKIVEEYPLNGPSTFIYPSIVWYQSPSEVQQC